MTLKPRPSLLSLACLTIAAVSLSAACKKAPPAATATPEPPPVEKAAPAETVNEQPMKPVVEEAPAPARAATADDLNRQGVLKAIYFDFDRYEVRPDQRPTMQANAQKLTGDLARFRLVIEGHADERGTNEYNMNLGDQRANAAREYLLSLGVPASRIRIVSYGEERPADPGHGEESWARNRRAEFLLEEG
ncbi:MAG TPA: peptidoglycan-associated lipoprotein Pal [Candidatus Polarisedimenticolia bacterium]|nr:peptidoglycan-associated lipoprotein Pal [Candidatus Polarisedimenticolia bacterium]